MLAQRQWMMATCVVVAIGIVVIALVSRDRQIEREPRAPPVALHPAQETPASYPSDGTRTVIDVPPATSESAIKPTREEVLAGYWGAEWPRIRQEAIEAGLDLDVEVSSPLPWVEIEEAVREKFLLSEVDRQSARRSLLNERLDLDLGEWLATHCDVDGIVIDAPFLAGVEDIVTKHATDIELAFDGYFQELDAAVQELWYTNRYRKAPFFLGSSPKVPMVKASSFIMRNWAVAYVVSTDEFPQLTGLARSVVTLVETRDGELKAYLASQR